MRLPLQLSRMTASIGRLGKIARQDDSRRFHISLSCSAHPYFKRKGIS